MVVSLSPSGGTGLGVGPRTVPDVSAGVCVSVGLGIRMVLEPVLVFVLALHLMFGMCATAARSVSSSEWV